MMRRRAAAVAALALVVLAAAGPAAAHPGGSTGYLSLRVDGPTVRLTLALWPAALPPAVAGDLGRAAAGPGPERERLLGLLREKLAVTAQVRPCEPGPASIAGEPDRVVLAVDFACPEPVRDLGIRDDLFDVLGPDHHTVARIDAAGSSAQRLLTPDDRSASVRLDGGAAPGLGGFVLLGIEHILTGWDHLLFLLALLLPGGRLLELLAIVTAFTVAHSVTLGAAALDLVALPPALVEAVIALSIAAVAAENLFLGCTVARRWAVSFAFGLVHGFGFSSVLREIGLPAGAVLPSLLGFNAGVELGQALVVAVALPALTALKAAGWHAGFARASSVAVLVAGLALFVQRVAG